MRERPRRRSQMPRNDEAAVRALSDSEARFSSLLAAAQEGVWVLDAGRRITVANERVATLVGVPAGDMVGRSVLDFLDLRAIGAFPADAREMRLLRADGTAIAALVANRPLVDADGRMTGRVVMVTDVTAARATEAALARESRLDPLTGLPNRAQFMERLEHALSSESAARERPAGERRATGKPGMAVLVVDVDRFRWVYDSLGPKGGDELLVAVAQRLRSALRPADTVARSGGDEYAVLCEDLKDEQAALAVAERVAGCVTLPFTLGDRQFGMTVSVGVAFVESRRTTDAEALMCDAGVAMAAAKTHGGARVELFDDELRVHALGRVEMETALRTAIELDQLVVHYQPVVQLATGGVVGVEALVRWQHPTRGLVPPLDFIPVAEETGLIIPIGALVLRSACGDVARWNRAHPERLPLTVAVNLSARQLVSAGLAEQVAGALSDARLDAGLLCMEITESVLMEDGPAARATLLGLKELGVTLAVDDFGTGYSSLLYLRQFPVDLLKVDRSFVAGLGHSPQDAAIVAGVVGLAQGLELAAVAEGVETSEQACRLAELGCDLAQGFHWSPALGAEELGRWLDDFCVDTPRAPVGGARRPIRVVIADDQRHVRDAVRLVLELEGGFEVVAEAGDGWEAVELTRRHQPDVVLLDLLMPGLGGVQALPHLLGVAPDAKIVVLTALERGHVDRQMLSGVAGCLEKSEDLAAIAGQLVHLVQLAA